MSTMQIQFNQQVNMYCIQWYMPLMPQAGHNVVRSESSLLYLLFFVGWHCQLPLTTFCAVLVCDEPTKHTIACKAWLQLANIIFAWHVFKEPEQNTLKLSYVNIYKYVDELPFISVQDALLRASIFWRLIRICFYRCFLVRICSRIAFKLAVINAKNKKRQWYCARRWL